MVRGLLTQSKHDHPAATIDLLSIYPGERWPRIAGASAVLTAVASASPPDAWPDRLRSLLARYNAFVVIGADVLDGHYSVDDSRQRIMLAQMAADANLPVTILGFSVNEHPVESVIADLRAFAPRGTLRLRDAKSLRRLRSRGVPHLVPVADLAFLMPPSAGARNCLEIEHWLDEERASGRTVAIFNLSSAVLTAARRAGNTSVLEEFSRVIAKLIINQGVSALLLPHDLRSGSADTPHDVTIAGALSERLRAAVGRDHHVMFVPSNAPDAKRLAGHADLVVTGRMHLAIAALGMQTPAVGIGYQGKFEGLMEHFGLDDAIVEAVAFDAARLEASASV